MTRRGEEALAVAVPLALAVVAFVQVLGYPFVNWDDPSHFLDNPLAAHPLANGWRGLFWTREIGYPAPVLLLSFALDRVLFGLSPGPYHAENLALHLANVAMLYALARRMRLPPAQACVVAALFAVHPLVAEPVSWVTGRKDVLSTTMLLAAVHIASRGSDEDDPGAKGRWLAASFLAVLCVLVLPRMVVAPLLVVLLVHGIRPAWSVRRMALRMAPSASIAVGIAALGAMQVAELGAVSSRRWMDVPLDIGGALALQLGHLVWPVDLLAYYIRVPGDPPVWKMVLAVAVAVAALGLALTRTSKDSPVRLGFLAAAIAYAPVSCVFRIVRWTADSYMYVPLLAVSLAIVPLVARAWPKNLARFGMWACAALAVTLALLSFTASERYRSSTSVWAGSIARYPNEPLSFEHEALGLLHDGHFDEANTLFREMAVRFPDWSDTFDDEVRAYVAAGDEPRAAQVLARGVRAGSLECIRMYWMGLLRAPSLPEAADRELVRVAFRNGFGAMKEGLHDPAQFRRVAEILRAVDLREDADQAAAHAEELERRLR